MRTRLTVVALAVTLLIAVPHLAQAQAITKWPEYQHDHRRQINRGLERPRVPFGGNLTVAWLNARADYLQERQRRIDRWYHKWQRLHEQELADLAASQYVPAPGGGYNGSGVADWDAIAACEGGGRWSLVTTGNGYWFVLQFAVGTWNAYRGGLPAISWYEANWTYPARGDMIAVAERVLAAQGPGAWPNCFAYA